MRSVWIIAARLPFETWVSLNETGSRYSKRVCVDILWWAARGISW